MFELLAFKPEVAKALRVYVALAPVAFHGGISNPTRLLAATPKALLKAALYTNVEVQKNSPLNEIFGDTICRALPGLICKNALDIVAGFSEGQVNSSVSLFSRKLLSFSF